MNNIDKFSISKDSRNFGNAIGLIELSSIAMGYQTTDAMLKAANVELVLARTVCPGKYISLVWGDVAAVEASVAAGLSVAKGFIVNDLVIPNLHPQVFPAMTATNQIKAVESLGIVETFDIVSSILAADASVKAANVDLCELRVAMAIGGKAFYTLTGDVAAVEAAVEAGKNVIEGKGQIVFAVVIPRPSPELFREIV
ncbi:MAG: BMC domain-containing protein [Candidatus Riflebacteria bacterium]|nr:BMC domain-containing protein [Candidatus Riflebacteria bacterium]